MQSVSMSSPAPLWACSRSATMFRCRRPPASSSYQAVRPRARYRAQARPQISHVRFAGPYREDEPMAGITGQITSTTLKKLQAQDDGVTARVAAIVSADAHLASVGIRTIAAHNISVDVSEKTGHAQYPALLVYCDKL